MPHPHQNGLSRRERQIVDVLYRLGEAGAAEVVQHLTDRPSYNSVRVTLGILERKGVVRHWRDGARYVYAPTLPPEKARESALRHLVRTFFRGSTSKAALTLLEDELCARLPVFEYEASSQGHDDCVRAFRRLAEPERQSFNEVLACLRRHIDEYLDTVQVESRELFVGDPAVGEIEGEVRCEVGERIDERNRRDDGSLRHRPLRNAGVAEGDRSPGR